MSASVAMAACAASNFLLAIAIRINTLRKNILDQYAYIVGARRWEEE
jgi:hypothetical protein